MNIEEIREYCLAKIGVAESFPFDDETLVFKIMDKIFALINLEGDLSINLKCDPETAIQLRVQYPSVLPGYHMNKNHWNTILIDGLVNDQLIYQWIDHSYHLVVERLTRKQKDELGKL